MASAFLLDVALAVSAQELAVARYSTIRAVPTVAQRNLLADVATMTFPATVTRVGQAIETLLAPSGYRLAHAQAENPERAPLLALPLRVALQTLAGPVFTVV